MASRSARIPASKTGIDRPPKVVLRPDQDPIRRSVARVAATLQGEGITVVETNRLDVTTPAGTISIPIVVEERGQHHAVFVTHESYTEKELPHILRIAAVLRAGDEFRRSRIVVYSPRPLPAILLHYLSRKPVALFETQCILAGQPPAKWRPLPPFAKVAERCRKLVAEFFDRKLDFTPGNLTVLDELLPHFRAAGAPQMLDKTLLLLGSYLGEVMVRHRAASWTRDPTEVLASTVSALGAPEPFWPFFVVRKAVITDRPSTKAPFDQYAQYLVHLKDHESAPAITPMDGASSPLGERNSADSTGPTEAQREALRRESDDD